MFCKNKLPLTSCSQNLFLKFLLFVLLFRMMTSKKASILNSRNHYYIYEYMKPCFQRFNRKTCEFFFQNNICTHTIATPTHKRTVYIRWVGGGVYPPPLFSDHCSKFTSFEFSIRAGMVSITCVWMGECEHCVDTVSHLAPPRRGGGKGGRGFKIKDPPHFWPLLLTISHALHIHIQSSHPPPPHSTL